MLDTEKIITKFYIRGSKIYDILMDHGMRVASKAIEILDKIPNIINVDTNFIIEASMLHDIGVCRTFAESIGCTGSLPYLCHGFEGRKILNKFGLFKHGLVCERHIGAGLSTEDIVKMKLPIPIRNMFPVSFEEKLICYSDKFFSKGLGTSERNIDAILNDLSRHGKKNAASFLKIHRYFTNSSSYLTN